MFYWIQNQKQGDEYVPIKEISKYETENKEGERVTYRIRGESGDEQPVLRIVIASGMDFEIHVKWNNHYDNHTNKGVFRIVRRDLKKPVMIYVTSNGRKCKTNNRDQIDYTAMASKYGSTYEKYVGWTFGEQQEYTHDDTLLSEHETMADFCKAMEKQFGQELAAKAISLFLSKNCFTGMPRGELACQG